MNLESNEMSLQERYETGYKYGLKDKLVTNKIDRSIFEQGNGGLVDYSDAFMMGYFHALNDVPLSPVGEKVEYKMNTNCQECGMLIKRYTSESDIKLEYFTNTGAGEYPPNLCPCCWNYMRDPNMTRENNPRCQPNRYRTEEMHSE